MLLDLHTDSQETGKVVWTPISLRLIQFVVIQKVKKILSIEQLLSGVRLFATPWTVAYQAPLSMGFSRQEYWSVLPFPSPGDLPNPGFKPWSPALQTDALPSKPPGRVLFLAGLELNRYRVGRCQQRNPDKNEKWILDAESN